MLESCEINPGLGCTMAPKSIEITRQMSYLTQSYEEYTVPHERMNISIGNVRRLLLNVPHPYQPLSNKTCQYPR